MRFNTESFLWLAIRTTRALQIAVCLLLFAAPSSMGQPAPVLDFAQIAVGGGYRSFLLADNPNSSATKLVASFRSPTGEDLLLQINGVTNSSVMLVIPPQGSVKLQLDGSAAQVMTGWCQVFASQPVSGVLIYQLFDNNQLLSGASVLRCPRGRKFTVTVPKLGSQTDTGLAIANADELSTSVTIKRINLDGTVGGQVSLTLGPGEQTSRFINQFFPSLPPLEGRVEIVSSRDIVAIGLVYQGSQFTTVPVVPLP